MAKYTKLRASHAAFIDELFKDPRRDVGPAYARAFGVADSPQARSCANRVLRNPIVQAEVARRQAIEDEKRGITAEEVVREITLLAKADPRDIFNVYRGACRYCHGVGHLYQRTPREFRDAWAKHTKDHPEDVAGLGFDHLGGVGFNRTARPHTGCPECFGEGETYEVIKDSREWTTGAARLFSGLHRTKDGLKISMRSQDGALKLAAQLHHLLAGEDDPSDNTPPPSTINYEAQDATKKGRKQ